MQDFLLPHAAGALQAARQPPHLASWLFGTKNHDENAGDLCWDLCRIASEARTRPVPAAGLRGGAAGGAAGPHGHKAGSRRGAPGLPHDPPAVPAHLTTPHGAPIRPKPLRPCPRAWRCATTRRRARALPRPQAAPPPFRDPPGRPLRPCRRCHLPWPSLCRPPAARGGGCPRPPRLPERGSERESDGRAPGGPGRAGCPPLRCRLLPPDGGQR